MESETGTVHFSSENSVILQFFYKFIDRIGRPRNGHAVVAVVAGDCDVVRYEFCHLVLRQPYNQNDFSVQGCR